MQYGGVNVHNRLGLIHFIESRGQIVKLPFEVRELKLVFIEYCMHLSGERIIYQ